MSRHSSLSRRIPIFLATLLAVVLGTAAAVEYVHLERLLLRENEDRLSSATGLVSQILSDQLVDGVDALQTRADSMLRRVLDQTSLPSAEADSMLQEALEDGNGGRAFWLVRDDGTCVAAVGPRTAGDPEPTCADVGDEGWPTEGSFGPIVDIGNEARYRVVVPARAPGWTGRAVFEEAFTSGEGGALVSTLVAPDAQLLVGNHAGGVWTDLGTVVERDIPVDQREPTARFDADGDERIAVVSTIGGTPWVALIHRSVGVVVGPSRTFLAWIAVTGMLILLISSGIAWLLSLRVTSPLSSLTRGAEAIAAGEYGRRVTVGRDDEIGRLGDAFNAMAEEVDHNRQALEARVEARTRSLQEAMARLEEAQEALVRKERLATIGQLAGSVGHELRNPLGVMTNALFYLNAVNENASPKVREYMGILGDQVRTAEKIVSDLLDFARVKSPERDAIPVRSLVEDVLGSVEVPGRISVEVDIAEDTPPIVADRVHVSQILQNLTTNAVQAMEEEGRLSFSAESSNGFVTLLVTDDGAGIPADALPHVFEPLVTSKARGIGLGLAVSRSLAEANDGTLSARSELGVGSTFALTLPSAERTEAR